MKGLRLIATGGALPGRTVTNEELSRTVDTSDEWITTRTGIRTRHYCTEGENAATLAIAAAKQALPAVIDALEAGEKQDNRPAFVKNAKNEGVMTPGDVQNCAEGYNMVELGFGYDGATAVMKTILATDYLWNRIRVLGGAYGAILTIRPNGTFLLSSYRDPNLENTYKVYDGMAEYLEKFDPSRREMDKYILGTLQELDAPKVGQLAHSTALGNYMTGFTKATQQKLRAEAIAADAKAIRAKAALANAICEKHYICAVGNSEKIKAAKELFKDIIDG